MEFFRVKQEEDTEQKPRAGQRTRFNFCRERRSALWEARGSSFCAMPGFLQCLGSFFCHEGMCGFSGLRSDDLHFLPVIAEFSAAIQASDIGARSLSRRRTTRTGAHRDGKAVASVPATEHGVHHFRKHWEPPQIQTQGLKQQQNKTERQNTHPLRSKNRWELTT